MTKKTSPAYRASKEETIPINKLHPFSNHPFHIRHDLEFSELVDSISESGIITPIIVRPKVGVGYEVISGHRRWEACKELGIESIPARVEYIDDDEATILMVNSNIQREHVLPSEKAFAYKMRMEALKHQGRTTLAQVGPKFSSEKIAAETGDSRNQVKRYIRLTYLIPSILQMVDDGRIAFNPAVEISYMTEEHQTWLKEEMDMCDATPSLVQSRTLKEMSRNGTLTENYLHGCHIQQYAEDNFRIGCYVAPEHPQPGDNLDKLQVYQITKGGCEYRFMNYAYSKSRIHAADYSSVYIANLPADYDLDRCFQEFNAPNRPLRYHMCSLSTSDIVVTTKNGNETAYYVDSIGFKDVSHLLPELHEVEAQHQKEQVQDEPER